MSAVIDIECRHLTASGYRYRVFHDGDILIESCRDPLTSAARALVEKGVTGRVQMRRLGSESIDMEGLIAVLATRTVAENQIHGPRFAKWSPHWAGAATVSESQAKASEDNGSITGGAGAVTGEVSRQRRRRRDSRERPATVSEATL